MMLPRKDNPVVTLSLLLALASATEPFIQSFLTVNPALAQSPAPSFTLPPVVPKDQKVRVDGSTSMKSINDVLKEKYAAKYPGTAVDFEYNGTPAAIQAVLDGKVDIAAIGRALTDEEKAKGLKQIVVARHKIAMIVGPNNPFKGSLEDRQFAQIFRGEITDWSKVGGTPGAIRFIDRPDNSDTRQAFRNYPVFKSAPFQTAASAVKTQEDSTEAIIKELGNDGISYAIADQVLNKPEVRVLQMHKTLPDDPRYPFSQPLVYVYKDIPPVAAQAFLAAAAAPENKQTIEAARVEGAIAATAAPLVAASPDASTSPSPTASPSAAAPSPSPESPPAQTGARDISPWWLLLPIGIVGLAWLFGRRRTPASTGTVPPASEAPAPESAAFRTVPPPASPEAVPPAVPSTAEAAPVASPEVVPPVVPSPSEVPPISPLPGIAPPVADVPNVSPGATAGAVTDTVEPAQPSGVGIPTAVAGAAALGAGAAAIAGLAGGKARSQITLSPRDHHQAYAHWEAPEEHKDEVKAQGGENLVLRLYDVTGLNPETETPNSSEEFDVADWTTDRNVPIPEYNHDYVAEVGYLTGDGRFLPLARSNSIRVSPPEYKDEEASRLAYEPPEHKPEEPSTDTAQMVSTPITAVQSAEAGEWIFGEPPISSEAPSEAPNEAPRIDPTLAGAALAAGAGAFALSSLSTDDQSAVEAAKFDVGQTDLRGEDLASVDKGLPELPDGYGESRIVLLPRDPQWAYTYWDAPNEHKEEVRRQGGQKFALRIYDVTDIDLNHQAPHSLQQYDCDELARDWYVPIPVSDRDYIAEIGYLTADGRWLTLARSIPCRIPPVFPSDWYEDYFATIEWDEDLRGKTFATLIPPSQRIATGNPIYDQIFGMAESAEAMRVAGSLFGSMQHIPGSVFGSAQMVSETAISSYVFPSGIGMWSVPTVSGLTASGIGFSASMPPIRARKFWLVADAELIIYGATEPDATVTIAGRPIQLNPDGTFRFQMSFQDGLLDFPIMAVAADGEQNRSIHMKFVRETPVRNTNTKEEAREEEY